MSPEKAFTWRRERDEPFGLDFIVLCGPGENGADLEAWIAPGCGSNLCRLKHGGESIIDFEGEVLANREYSGAPVLYPTPNRVRSGIFKYRGKLYNQVKRGEPVFEHGLVHDEAWRHSEPVVHNGAVVMETWIDFEPGSPLFESFPFPHRLGLSFRLDARGVSVSYSIRNDGPEAVPYGFGIHPYFMKLCGEDGTSILVPASSLMDYTSDLLPTGRLIETKGTQFDLRKPVSIGSLDLDHVFTDMLPGDCAEVRYPAKGIKVALHATADFSHIVVYSPRGKGYFCIENQTCSTDAHNLHDRGFTHASGLKTAEPGQATGGTVEYRIERL